MNLLIIIMSFVLAYGIFILIAYKLSKVFFPKSEEVNPFERNDAA